MGMEIMKKEKRNGIEINGETITFKQEKSALEILEEKFGTDFSF